MIKEIIVVEGKEDTASVRRAVEADTIETGGSAIDAEVLERIRLAQERRGVIVLTDPDHAGERIRRIISNAVPGCKHAFIDREQARRKQEIGVEHAPPEVIRAALEQVRTVAEPGEGSEVGWQDMLRAGLVVRADAARRRMEVGRRLHIGFANGKQFLKRCAMFRITGEEFWEAVRALDAEAKDGEHR